MTEDDSSSSQEKTWLGKLAHAFSGEPQSREELAGTLRAA
ncbi:MAG: magnesium/cobalt efflux protein, partial [Gammaproteobacteria bacterium]